MKHKRYNEVFPYTYYVQHRASKKKYYGVRYANVGLGVSPKEDLGIKYFTSGKLKHDFKYNTNDYDFRVVWTFDTKEEAIEHEVRFLLKVYKKDDWLNNSVSKAIINFTEEVRQNISKSLYVENSEGVRPIDIITDKVKKSKYKILPNGLTLGKYASLKAAETMENTIMEDGRTLKEHRIEKGHLTRLEIGDDGMNAYQRGGLLSGITKTTVGEDGLTSSQRAAAKNPFCQKGTPQASSVGRKRNNKFNEKLVNMTDEEFEEFLQGKSELWQGLTRARRQKHLKLTEKE